MEDGTVDEISIRRCGRSDAQTLAVVGVATFLDAYSGRMPGRSIVEHCKVNHSAEAYAKYLEEAGTRVWLAETVAQEGPVGYAILTAPDLPLADLSEDDVELKRIYVLTRFHGSGVGRRLMQTALEEARAMGRRRVLLGMHPDNARALAFYEKAGFQVVGRRRFQMGFNIYDDLVLGCVL